MSDADERRAKANRLHSIALTIERGAMRLEPGDHPGIAEDDPALVQIRAELRAYSEAAANLIRLIAELIRRGEAIQ